MSLTERSFERFPDYRARLHSEILTPQLYDVDFRAWLDKLGPAFESWALAGPPIEERLAFPTIADVATVGRAQSPAAVRKLRHIAGRTVRESRFRIRPTYARVRLEKERFAWFDQMRCVIEACASSVKSWW